MARNGRSKSSFGQAKGPGRQLAARHARLEPAATVAEPRDSNSVLAGEYGGQRIDQGEKSATPPFTLLVFPARDGSVPPSKKGRPRRRYGEEERRGVAETRRRGACESCKASKTKCNHDPSKTTTDQYRMQSQSHELFALGLTTHSLTANEDKHKQVMEKTIAALNDKLIQKDQTGQNHGANSDGNIKSMGVAVPSSPPEPSTLKGPSSQKPNLPPKVHQRVRQTLPKLFEQGLKKIRLNDGVKQKQRSPRHSKKNASKAKSDTTLGKKKVDERKTSASPLPIVYQQQSLGSMLSTSPMKELCSDALTPQRSFLREAVPIQSRESLDSTQLGCKSTQTSTIADHLKVPNVLRLKSEPNSLTMRRRSGSPEQDNRTMATDESMLSFGRSPSPSSDRLPSKPPSFVHMSDLERSKSYDQALPEANFAIISGHPARELEGSSPHNTSAMPGNEHFSYVDFLEEDGFTPFGDIIYHFPACEKGEVDALCNGTKAEPLLTLLSDMDVDDLSDC